MPALIAPFAAALPKLARLAASPLGAETPLNIPLAPTAFSPGCMVEQLNTTTDKMLGSRTHSASGSVDNLVRVRPAASFKPSVAEWANLLPWCLCGTPTGTGPFVYPLGDREVSRALAFDDTQRLWTMLGVVVGSATLAASAGGALSVDLDCVGTTYTTGATSGFPAGLSFPTGAPFMMTQLALTIGGTTTVPCRSARLSIDNGIDAERYFYGGTISGAVATDRTVTVDLEIPYGLSTAVWNAGAGAGGVAVTLTFTRGSQSLVFAMPNVRAVAPPPQASVPNEMFINWTGEALSDTSNGELTVTYTP